MDYICEFSPGVGRRGRSFVVVSRWSVHLAIFITGVTLDRVVSDDSRDTPAEQPSGDPSADDIFELLAHHRRRYVIECLDRYGSPMSLPDLADECVVMEHEQTLDDIPAEAVKRMYMSLYHCHVPKMVEINAIEYDQARDLVTTGPAIAQFHAHMDLTRNALSSTAERAFEALRGAIDTGGDGDSADGLTITHTRKTLRNAGYDEETMRWLINRLERTGYIYFVGDCVRLVD